MSSLTEKLGIPAGSDAAMELHLFKLLCLSATVVSFLLVLPADFIIHLSPTIIVTDSIFGIASFFFYRAARRGVCLLKTLFFLYLLDLNIGWFANNGSQGSVIAYFFVVFIYAMIFFRRRLRWHLLAVALVDVLALLATEPLFSAWIVPYHTQSDQLSDQMLALTIAALSCSLMLWAVLSSYDREQQHLKSLNAELEYSMAERIEAEHSLRQNRELLNAVIEGTTDAVYAKDTEGRYVLFNSGAARFTGKTPAQALGQDDTRIFPADEALMLMGADREIIRRGEIVVLEHVLTNAAGEKTVVQATKGPLRDENGEVFGVFGISRDVTDSRRVEDEIRKLNKQLDQRVVERTARLEAAIKEQESFSYSVSHDLRAPLRHINSYSALLIEECGSCLSPEALVYLERIRYSSRSMGQLIDDLLELSRIGRSSLQKTAVNLSELAWVILKRMQESEPVRDVEVTVAEGLVTHGDRILLQQALQNLLDNAWKYTSRRDKARIEVGVTRVAGEEVFFVRDNGVGFDMAYRDKLFGAFQRLHGAEFEGTGIGLATVKRIVKRHGGEVWAEGAVDQGAAVYFTIPDNDLLPESAGCPGIGSCATRRAPDQASR